MCISHACLLLLIFLFCAEQCSFVEHRNYKIVYRRYASLFFLVGVDNDEVSFVLSLALFTFPCDQLVLLF